MQTCDWKCASVPCREVVERRIHIVTGKKPLSKEVDRLIDTGESEAVFKVAIQKEGRGHVSQHAYPSLVTIHVHGNYSTTPALLLRLYAQISAALHHLAEICFKAILTALVAMDISLHTCFVAFHT